MTIADDEASREGRLPRGHRLRHAVSAAVRSLTDMIVPPACLACHTPIADHDALCAECWRGIDFIRSPLCDRLGLPLPFDIGGTMVSAAAAAAPPGYNRARAVARFDATMRRLVHDLKFHDRQQGRVLLGRLLAAAGSDLLVDAQLIVPVPLNRWRLLSRRFNQSAILSREVSRLTGIAWTPSALVRVRRTASQVDLTPDQRRANVSGAFKVTARGRDDIADRSILLIDDVITTGATVEACTRALRRAGARRVDVLALALVSDRARATT